MSILPLTPPLSPIQPKQPDQDTLAASFMDACQRGDYDQVRTILTTSAPGLINCINTLDNDCTGLHYAVLKRSRPLLDLLLTRGAHPGLPARTGATPLHWAAGLGECGLVSLLIRARAPIDVVDASGYLPIHMAAQGGHTLTVLLLCAHSSPTEPFPVDSGGRTALHWAAIKNHVDMIVALATLASYLDRTSALLDATDHDNQMTALHWAAHGCHADACRELLQRGASPAIRDIKGRLPLDLAMAKGFQRYYELALLDGGMIVGGGGGVGGGKSMLRVRIAPNIAKFWVGRVFAHVHIPYITLCIGYSPLWAFPLLVGLMLMAHYLIAQFIMPTIPLLETNFMHSMHWSYYYFGVILFTCLVLPGTHHLLI